jgi:hypothetical protein
MKKPTFASVTEIPCSCGYLDGCARDSSVPVKYDPYLNEYSFNYTLPKGTPVSLPIYHCPMCGGVASESKRDQLFATVSDEEVERLNALIGTAKSIAEVVRDIGEPDEEQVVHLPPDFSAIQPDGATPVRTLTYARLSQTATVQFIEYSDKHVKRAIMGKYIGADRHLRKVSSKGRKKKKS